MSMHPRVLRAAPDPEAIAQAEAMRGVKYLPGNGVASGRLPVAPQYCGRFSIRQLGDGGARA